MGGGGDKPKPAKPPVRVEYKKEAPRGERAKKGKKRAVPSMYRQSRTATQNGSGFGGQKQTLG